MTSPHISYHCDDVTSFSRHSCHMHSDLARIRVSHHQIRNMPKAKVKKCYQSAVGARHPKCYEGGPTMCPPCMDALDIYKQVKAYKATQRIQNNRASAARSRLNKDQKRSDIHSDHLALKTEYEELAQEYRGIGEPR